MMLKRRKWMAALLAVCLLLSSVAPVAAADSNSTDANGDWIYQETEDGLQNYSEYIEQYEGYACPETEVTVDVTNFRVEEPDYSTQASGTALYQNMFGSDTGLNIAAKGEKVVFSVQVPESGLYCVEMNYYPFIEKHTQISFGLYIDGELPFVEANDCRLDRVFRNGEVKQDSYGDDLRPQSEQLAQWQTKMLQEQTGVYGMLQFYLEAGSHEIALCFDGNPLLLQGMKLKQEPYLLSYQDYISLYEQKGYSETKQVMELFQAETYYQQSSSTLWPDYDKSSPLTQPFSYENNKLNFGGGKQWKEPGQWISWTINAPEDGFYYIGCKYKQGYLDGLFSSRKVYIDGEVPFAELSSIRFDYTTQWENFYLQGSSGEPYKIFLTKGEHILTMENVIGDLSSTVGVLQNAIDQLNELYLSIIMITSSEPDTYRDYYLEDQLPNLSADLKKIADRLSTEAKRVEELVGKKGAEGAYFEDVAYNLRSYADNIVDLTHKNRITNFKNDISGLSSKLSEYQQQALDLDYIALASPGENMPKTTMNFWQWLVYQVKSFIVSFTTNRYEDSENEAIRVWVNTGTDQFQIIQQMITDTFTPQTGIEVELKLVQGSLIEAKVSGKGPDIQIGADSSTVVNLGLRGALVDLSTFDDYWDVLRDNEYMEGSEIPFRLEGKYFGLPTSNAFSVMFVRTDIFQRMGLKVPNTWDDMYDVAQVLQRYNMTLGSAPSFASLLYQNGGSYYNEELTEVQFTSDVAVDALTQHAEFYTKYGFPISFDFVSRFRTGEMPIAIAGYSNYNSLKYSAPEISGLWEMFLMPGSVQKDGSVNYTQVDNSVTGIIMLESAKRQDACWEFMKWWVDYKSQTQYAIDVEAALGVASRYTPASMKTLRELGWTTEELNVLLDQASKIEFIPIVPGDYYVSRGLNNSFRGVIYDNANPREILTEWTIKINDELRRKYLEFHKNN